MRLINYYFFFIIQGYLLDFGIIIIISQALRRFSFLFVENLAEPVVVPDVIRYTVMSRA